MHLGSVAWLSVLRCPKLANLDFDLFANSAALGAGNFLDTRSTAAAAFFDLTVRLGLQQRVRARLASTTHGAKQRTQTM